MFTLIYNMQNHESLWIVVRCRHFPTPGNEGKWLPSSCETGGARSHPPDSAAASSSSFTPRSPPLQAPSSPTGGHGVFPIPGPVERFRFLFRQLASQPLLEPTTTSDGLSVDEIIARRWPILDESESDWRSHPAAIASSLRGGSRYGADWDCNPCFFLKCLFVVTCEFVDVIVAKVGALVGVFEREDESIGFVGQSGLGGEG